MDTNAGQCPALTTLEKQSRLLKKTSRSNQKLPRHAPTPIASGYRPELDSYDELNSSETQYYQELIGILRWSTELGWVDISHELSMLSPHQSNPRQGYMDQLLHVFAF